MGGDRTAFHAGAALDALSRRPRRPQVQFFTRNILARVEFFWSTRPHCHPYTRPESDSYLLPPSQNN